MKTEKEIKSKLKKMQNALDNDTCECDFDEVNIVLHNNN